MTAFNIFKDGDRARLEGPINGSVQLATILELPTINIVDFAAVTSINSTGAASMFEFTTRWNGRQFTYVNCPPCIVDALLMLPSLLGPEDKPAKVKSFLIPYRCPKCDDTEMFSVEARDVKVTKDDVTMPVRACQHCKKTMDVEAAVNEYRQLL